MYSLHIFSPHLQAVSALIDGFLSCAMGFQFDWIPFIYVCFCHLWFWDQIQEALYRSISRSFSSIFSSNNFMVPVLKFRFLIHFELICTSGVSYRSNFILWCVDSQFPKHYLLKRVSPLCVPGTFVKGQFTINVGSYSEPSILFHWSKCLFLCQCHGVMIPTVF